MPPERDENTGKFEEEYQRNSFLEAVEGIDSATTTKVAERVGCSYDLAYRRLKGLTEEGDLSCVKVGNTFIWSRK